MRGLLIVVAGVVAAIALALVSAVAVEGPGLAWAEGEEAVGDQVSGQSLYEAHCVVCHGQDARGSGPMAPVLLVQPADLTTLIARHGGVFPLERVVTRIDGRDPLVAHGSDMPVYGAFYEGGRDVALRTEAGQPILTSQPIADLVAWLRTIQE
jgi:mono/diheme cytochrome c family protein